MRYRVARWRNQRGRGDSGIDPHQGAFGRAAAGVLYVEQCWSAEGIVAEGHDELDVRRVRRLVHMAVHRRRRPPRS
jgi:hypothetical protein